jgi:single-strand DNA-binding protein
MASFNRVILLGNLTKDPELRYTPSGTAVTNLRLAVNSSFKGQDGQRKEETCFVTVVVWSKQAETCNQYLKKGRPVLVEGRLIYRSWEVEGKTRSLLEVRADRVQFLGSPGGAPGGGFRDEAVSSGSSDEPRADEPVTPAADPAFGGEAEPVGGNAGADVPF